MDATWKFFKKLRFFLPAILLCSAIIGSIPAHGFVTSAVLEFYGDDKIGFHLNGRKLLDIGNCDLMYFWFDALSTSDGTLPLELFHNNQDNLLATENFDLYGGVMYCSYRLTVHQSSGDPIVIWGEAGKTKFLNIHRGQPEPQGWTLPNFDDSSWGTPKEVAMDPNDYGNFIHLDDNHFRAMLGLRGYVPVLSHNSTGVTNPMDIDLYRSHFQFPNNMSKATMLMNPQAANAGQQVAFRIVPGRDVADLSAFRMFAYMPKGIEPIQILNHGVYDKVKRLLTWDFPAGFNTVKYTKMNAIQVLEAPSWESPEKALGAFKPILRAETLKTPPAILTDGAAFYPGLAAWFRLNNPSIADGPGAPVILGVMLRGQFRVGGRDHNTRKGANQVFVNYSVDGTNRPALSDYVQFTHAANDDHWVNGYYDATEDRKWTWTDINNLRVSIKSEIASERQKDYMGSLTVIVRSYQPANITSAFLAQVTDRMCTNLDIKAGVVELGSGMSAMDSYTLPINQGYCPTPTPVPTPIPPKPGDTPVPTPVPTAVRLNLGLSCLQNSPEPFKRGGTFIYFCLKHEAKVTVNVYNATGALVRTIQAGEFRAGNNQVFFNGLDNHGNYLPGGNYVYEISAMAEGTAQNRNSRFTKIEE